MGHYKALIKSRQTLLLLATGVAGYPTARPHSASPGEVAGMLLSLFAAVSGTTALNMAFDRDIDARMTRTADRPLPSGRLSPDQGALFGAVLVALGLGTVLSMGPIFASVIAAGVILDLVIYTLWLERRSPWSIVFSGIVGGMPILAGRALGVGRLDGLGLLGLSGTAMLGLSLWAVWRPSDRINYVLFKVASVHIAGIDGAVHPRSHGLNPTEYVAHVAG